MDSHTLTIWRNIPWWWKLAGLTELALGFVFLCIGIINEDPNAFPLAAGATTIGMLILAVGRSEAKYQLLAQRYATTRIELLALKAKMARHENL